LLATKKGTLSFSGGGDTIPFTSKIWSHL